MSTASSFPDYHLQMDTKKVPVSLCIVTNNLGDKMPEIINQLIGIVSEILIGFDGNMTEIPSFYTHKEGIQIVPVAWEGFSITKNKLAWRAKYDWILSLDGDEIPDDILVQQILDLPYKSLSTRHIYRLKRLSFFEGKKIKYGAWGRDKVHRLYHRDYSAWDQAIVHENLIQKEDTILLTLQGILLHYTADNFDSFLSKHEKYARLSARKYFESGKKSPLWKQYLSPLFSFIKEYIFQAGFLDGMAGLKIAYINTVYTFEKYKFLKELYQA